MALGCYLTGRPEGADCIWGITDPIQLVTGSHKRLFVIRESETYPEV